MSLPKKMTEYILSSGGEILTEAGVSHVDAKEHQIQLESGEVIGYRKLIWAANQKTLYDRINGLSTTNFEKQQTLAKQSIGGDSILTVFLGVNE